MIGATVMNGMSKGNVKIQLPLWSKAEGRSGIAVRCNELFAVDVLFHNVSAETA